MLASLWWKLCGETRDRGLGRSRSKRSGSLRVLQLEDRTMLSVVPVVDINAVTAGSITSSASFANINSILYFAANDGVHGLELWKSDGTASGTALVKDINPGASGSSPGNFVSFNNELFFTATDAINGTGLWKSDGTTNGTTLVAAIVSGSSSTNPHNLAVLGNTLLFV